MHVYSEGARDGLEEGAPHFPPLGQPNFVPKASRFLGMALGTRIGVTQGNPASPMIFNIVVDTVLRTVLEGVCGTQEE